jgi:predicted nucleotidyltransferase
MALDAMPPSFRVKLLSAPEYGTIVPVMGTGMHEELLGTTLFARSRRAVLAVLYGHPDQEFYLRQVIRASGGGAGGVQRELDRLAKAGILRRTVRGSQVYFQANADCPVYEELKALVAKTAGAADLLRAALAPIADRIRVAFVFGSMARAQQRAGSDVDLLVVGNVAFSEVVAALADAQAKLGREVNPTVYPPEEFIGKVCSGHHFLRGVLKREKIFLIGDEHELARLAQKRLGDRT